MPRRHHRLKYEKKNTERIICLEGISGVKSTPEMPRGHFKKSKMPRGHHRLQKKKSQYVYYVWRA